MSLPGFRQAVRGVEFPVIHIPHIIENDGEKVRLRQMALFFYRFFDDRMRRGLETV